MEKLWEEERQAWSSQGGSNPPPPMSWPWGPSPAASKAAQVPLSHSHSRQLQALELLQLACPGHGLMPVERKVTQI